MLYDHVSYAVTGGIATITIERPDVYNAFTRQTVLELNDAARTAEADDDVYAVILTGAGKGFCSGADTTAMPDWDDQTPEEYGAFLWIIQQFVWRLRQMATPSIAAVNGPAIGAGCDFALACDLRVVGETGIMREGFVNVGLVPGDGGAWLLPRLVGESKAREYLLTGRDIEPADAVDIGLAVEHADDGRRVADVDRQQHVRTPARRSRRPRRRPGRGRARSGSARRRRGGPHRPPRMPGPCPA